MMFRRVLVFLSGLMVLTLAACSSDSNPAAPTNPGGSNSVTTLRITDIRVGTGAEAVNGRTLTVNYTGWNYDQNAAGNKGSQFDTSIGRQPFQFQLGISNVITGWHQGLVGMRVGGLRNLVIPASLAYGSQGSSPNIPPNQALVFDVELLSVQ
jgi:FKBP-type peptidyl-prolyl cis-trans isomerase FkpA